jgi:uracil-DNA glycosylase family 4
MSDAPAWQALNQAVETCRACPRLVAWREQVAREKRRAYQDWSYWGRPVPSFGDRQARLLIVGLAPGAHGSNRTGRIFTGDSSGDTLYAALYETGFANQATSRRQGDGLKLTDALISAVARCVPPGNRPSPAELAACRPFLEQEWRLLTRLQVIVALGQLAFDGCLRLLRDLDYALPRLKFAHGRHYPLQPPAGAGPHHLLATYHPSRQNTQTGRLTPAMLRAVFAQARALLA